MENTKRLQIDLKQIKNLLGELRKAKLKCLQLSDHLNKDLPKLQKYQILQVRCTRTTDSFDKPGLIQLRNQLTESLAQLYEEERGLMYEVEKNSFKKVVRPPLVRRQRDYYSKQEIGPFKVPIYYNRPEPSINKIERVSNYIESIGKSMDCLRKSMQSQAQWKPQNFLQYEPEYLDLLSKIQQYKMRDQQLFQFLQKKVEDEKNRLITEATKGEEDGDFIIMKVPRMKVDGYGKPQQEVPKEPRSSRNPNINDTLHYPQSVIQPKRKALAKKPKLQKIRQEGNNEPNKIEVPQNQPMDLQIISFDKKNSASKSRASKIDKSSLDKDENGNFVYVVRKVSPDSQLNSSILSSISSLRSLRKKVFDDDIWDQFQKF